MAKQTIKYAAYDLENSLQVARVLYDRGGSGSADEVATLLGYKSRNNGAFLSRLASARYFGLVDGQSDMLSPSALAIDILRPDLPSTAARARLRAFEHVPLNKAVLDAYHGQVLPDNQGLVNALQVKWSVPAASAGPIAARLLDSAEQAGLFSVAGNRTKMIRPTNGGGVVPERHDRSEEPSRDRGPASQPSEGTVLNAQGQVSAAPSPPGDARASKLIDGALDLLPPTGTPWSEDELRQWLSFFESALRVVYRLPRGQQA